MSCFGNCFSKKVVEHVVEKNPNLKIKNRLRPKIEKTNPGIQTNVFRKLSTQSPNLCNDFNHGKTKDSRNR